LVEVSERQPSAVQQLPLLPAIHSQATATWQGKRDCGPLKGCGNFASLWIVDTSSVGATAEISRRVYLEEPLKTPSKSATDSSTFLHPSTAKLSSASAPTHYLAILGPDQGCPSTRDFRSLAHPRNFFGR